MLLVDDEVALARAYQRFLSKYHDVTVAQGLDAVSAMAAGRWYDVILLDVTTPASTGIELFERIRRADTKQAERIVFMTEGVVTPVDAFLDRIPNARLQKPLDTATLLAVVTELALK